MTFNDSKFGMVFPTRHGGSIGASEENRMLGALGGAGGIKTRIVNNPDGSSVMLRTRNGFPEFTYTAAPVKLVVSATDRTFVFTTVGGVLGTIYNKVGGVAKTGVAVSSASYYVGSLHTDTAVLWNDVWRTDKTAYSIGGAPVVTLAADKVSFRINGKIDNIVGTPVLFDYGRTSLPFICPPSGPYQGSATGDSTRSVLFIGVAGSVFRGVATVSKAGAEVSEVAPPNPEDYLDYTSANVFATDQGVFRFFGAKVAYDNSGTIPVNTKTRWAEIRATASAPYLEILSSGTNTILVGYALIDPRVPYAWSVESVANPYSIMPYTVTGVPTIISTMQIGGVPYSAVEVRYGAPVQSLVSSSTAKRYTRGYTVDLSDSASIAYQGSSLPLTISRKLSGVRHDDSFGGQYSQKIPVSLAVSIVNGTFTLANIGYDLTTDIALSAPAGLGLETLYSAVVRAYSLRTISDGFVVDVSYAYAGALRPGGSVNVRDSDLPAYYDTLAAGITIDPTGISSASQTNYPSQDTMVASVAGTFDTVDYIFADIAERVFVYLSAKLTYLYDPVIVTIGVTPAPRRSSTLEIKYVIDFRGTKYEFPAYSATVITPDPSATNAFGSPLVPLVDDKTPAAATTGAQYHKGHTPSPIFSPRFTSQGNCPYIAYTTLAEEAAGATSEIYVDFLVHPYSSRDMHAYPSASPYTGLTAFLAHQFDVIFHRYIQAANMTTFVPTQNTTTWDAVIFTTPTRIQFANGVKGPWQSVLGAGFSGNPATEISRI